MWKLELRYNSCYSGFRQSKMCRKKYYVNAYLGLNLHIVNFRYLCNIVLSEYVIKLTDVEYQQHIRNE